MSHRGSALFAYQSIVLESREVEWMDQLMRLWDEGAIKPRIARTFSFSEAAAAHHFIQDRANLGKVLLIP